MALCAGARECGYGYRAKPLQFYAVQPANKTKLPERFEEIGLEIGILLIVLAPLDAAFSTSPLRWRWMLILVLLGLVFIGVALRTEHRRRDDV